MAPTWLSIRVELIGGRGDRLWPRPGRLVTASSSHTFAALANTLDEAFARWDRSHLYVFEFGDGRRVGGPFDLWDEPDDVLDGAKTKLSSVQHEQQFAYVFDFGDDWVHLCSVAADRVDPLEVLGFVPRGPTVYSGWGDIPDQYGRRFEDDDGGAQVPQDPEGADLPDFLKHWTWS